MPQICTFYGLVILMNFKNHLPPHFHVWYGDYKIIITIKDGIVTGKMPQRALKMIFEWLELHKEELLQEWAKAQKGEKLKQILPLQ
jgi:predicted RNase H-like HicB family nuclease